MTDDAQVSFATHAFEAALRMLHEQPTISDLRAAVAGLRAEWLASDHSPAEGATVSFPRSFIVDQLAQISQSLTIDRARYYVERLRRVAGEPRTNGVNDLDLNRWQTYSDIQTDSLWQIDRRDASGAHTAGYWGNFVPQIPNQMMRRYTQPGDWVLDPFAGSGTTLIEARRLGRNCIGVELQPHVVEHTRTTVDAEPNRSDRVSVLTQGDSASFDFAAALHTYGVANAKLALLHPPYHDIIRFSDDPRDLSNCASPAAFVAQLGQVVTQVAQALANHGYLVLVIGDTYAKGEWQPLGFQAMHEVQQHGFLLKSIVVKNFEETTGKRAQKELWRYRALVGGFFVFKHEYLFVFEKR